MISFSCQLCKNISQDPAKDLINLMCEQNLNLSTAWKCDCIVCIHDWDENISAYCLRLKLLQFLVGKIESFNRRWGKKLYKFEFEVYVF